MLRSLNKPRKEDEKLTKSAALVTLASLAMMHIRICSTLLLLSPATYFVLLSSDKESDFTQIYFYNVDSLIDTLTKNYNR